MTAFDRLAEYYLPSPEHWWQHVEAYAENGIAHLTPEACLLARFVLPSWSDSEILSLVPLPSLAQDLILTHTPLAVHIHLAVGTLPEIRRLLETFFSPAETITFQRHGGPLKRRPWHQLQRLTPCHDGSPFLKTRSREEARPPNEGKGNPPRGSKKEPLS